MKKRIKTAMSILLIVALVLNFSACTDTNQTTKFTVTFDLQSGSGVFEKITDIESGATIDVPQGEPTKDGYDFVGWFKEASGGAEWNFATDTVTKNTTLYARWSAINYNINYILTKGEHNNPTTYNIETNTITLAAPHGVVGYTGSWDIVSIPKGSTGNKTVTAIWQANSYTVTYNEQGGDPLTPNTVEVEYDSDFELAVPEKDGSTFLGWYGEPEGGGTNFTDGDGKSLSVWNLTTNTTVYAKWSVYTQGLQYTINPDGESCSVSVGTAESINIVIAPEYNGLPVTEVSENGFKNCNSITSVVIPSSVVKLGANAFDSCTSLSTISMYGVTRIESRAFSGCTSLESVTFPQNLTYIGDYAFNGCTDLDGLYLHYSLTSISDSAFNGCTGLSIAWEYNPLLQIDVIKDRLTTLIFTVNTTSIAENAFQNLAGLKNVEIPTTVTEIGAGAFKGCVGLKSITVPYIGKNAAATSFEGVFGYIFGYENTNSQTPPQGLTYQASVSSGTNRYYHYYIPESLTEITVLSGEIKNGVLQNMAKLQALTLGDAVTSIALSTSVLKDAVNGCTSLAEIHASESNQAYSSTDGILFNKEKTTLLYFPTFRQGEYIVPNGVTSIGSAFRDCALLTKITLPQSVTTLSSYAFQGCAALSEIIMPAVRTFNSLAFGGCASLTSMSIPSGTTDIPSSLFSGCTSLNSVSIPEGVLAIGSNAFNNCTSLSSVTLPDSIVEISGDAFTNCPAAKAVGNVRIVDGKWVVKYPGNTEVTSITIPSGVVGIAGATFERYNYLTSVSFPASLRFVGSNVFSHSKIQNDSPSSGLYISNWLIYFAGADPSTPMHLTIPSGTVGLADGCIVQQLSGFTLPSSVKYVGKNTLNQNWGMYSAATIPSTVEYIGYRACFFNSEVTTINVDAKVIERNAFEDNAKLVNLTIGSNVTKIGAMAFSGSTALQTVTIPETVGVINSNAFANCPNLTIRVRAASKPAGWADDWSGGCSVIWGYTG